MASAAVSSYLLPHTATLCPPPLQIQKKTRRTTIRRRMFRTSTRSQNQCVQGPLDDIINEISSDIWNSPPDHSANPSFLNWANPLKAPSTWIVTPLPVSRAPSDQPLTIRKNRDSRSSTSSSSMGDSTCYPHNNSKEEVINGGAVGMTLSRDTAWPSFEPTNPSETTIRVLPGTAQQSLENMIENGPKSAPPRRTSSLRLFTSRFPRLHRTRTGESVDSISNAPDSISPTGTTSLLVNSDEASDPLSLDEPSDEAVEAYMKRNAHNCSKLRAIMERMAKRLPTQVEDEHDLPEDHATKRDAMPTTLGATIRTFPEVKILKEAQQDIDVVVEIEGVLHNQSTLSDTTIDVIFIIDNGYYVTKDCLQLATDAVNGAMYYLGRGDRISLYTTHCAHNPVTGNKPELHYPIRPFSSDSEHTFQELTANIRKCGTQVWEPACPNPSMTDVVLSIAKSLEDQDLKQDRTHVILLSPAACVLHDVSKTFSDIYIHRLNPAILPYLREPDLQDTICYKDCCKSVFVSNWTSYQSVPGRIKRILKNARLKSPVGELTDISIDVRTKEGCELIECFGSKEISHLRLGQVHSFFVRIRVDRNKTRGVDLDSVNPVFNSSLDVKGLRQEVHNAVAVGATKAHIFDVQLYHRNSINTMDCWNYTEAPFTLIKEQGGLAPPTDMASEVVKRQYFHRILQLNTDEARLELDKLVAALEPGNKTTRNVFERLSKEVECQAAIRKYERDYRQKLPLCPGPIDIEASHEWFLEL